ncbi:AEC family transporter [Thaumasiovibrio sp. DFM-14]|uniref:AEC family transporter n=1 Tax=Thaumasiovibrio sp. DFM-14 TaxID=3384792 RepID=UPI0039A3077D
MTIFISNLYEAFNITSPIFLMLILGIVLKKRQIITPAFIDTGSKLVFNLTLPAMLFLSIVKTPIGQAADLHLLSFALISNALIWGILMLATHWSPYPFAVTRVMVQGAFRANTGIIGVALMSNAYGEQGVAASAYYVAVITLLYNVLAVICLTPSGSHSNPGKMIKLLSRNPLILSILIASTFKLTNIELPDVILISSSYFADMTLPLALLCTGASLDFKQMKLNPWPGLISTTARLIIVPSIIVIAAILLGFRDSALALLFFMSASPTAAASYVMAKAMKGDDRLAANIIAMTTLGFVFTTSAGLAILKSYGLG